MFTMRMNKIKKNHCKTLKEQSRKKFVLGEDPSGKKLSDILSISKPWEHKIVGGGGKSRRTGIIRGLWMINWTNEQFIHTSQGS